MAEVPVGIEQVLRVVRILHSVMLATMVLYAVVTVRFLPAGAGPIDPTFFWSIAGVAIGFFFAAFLVRAKKTQPAVETLSAQPADAAGLKNWRVGTILSAVALECVVMFGVALYIQGAAPTQVALFFVLPILTMMLWFPKRP
ncbi:MAG TPA: hypothetical protein VGD60_06595 [Candidatus Acidoferrales bacterium]